MKGLTVKHGWKYFLLFLWPNNHEILTETVRVGNTDLAALQYIGDERQFHFMDWRAFLLP